MKHSNLDLENLLRGKGKDKKRTSEQKGKFKSKEMECGKVKGNGELNGK